MSETYINTSEPMPTQILGAAEDDIKRTALLIRIAHHDPDFQKQWRSYVRQDTLREDIFTHFQDPTTAVRAIGIVGYVELSAREEKAGPVASRMIKAEKFMRRLAEPAVRSALKGKLIEK